MSSIQPTRAEPLRVSVSEAKQKLSEYVSLAEIGLVVEISRYGRPIARLVSVSIPANNTTEIAK